jgi:UDP-MurNAc hydroxylase
VRLIVDPWLIGSCYWRSWWNFPEPPPELIGDLRPDYIYLTHLHWDHFHGATLKKLFPTTTRILVPKVNTTRMLDDLRWLGFRNLTEIPHGDSIKLAPDFTLGSYQFNFLSVDSALLLSVGGRTILDCNDCKHFGLPLRQITSTAPRIDFVLRSHSSATPIPYCIEGYKTMFPEMRSQQNYIEEFSRFALHIGARYAIPFASNHCFLHKDTIRFNHTAVCPDDVQSSYLRLAAKAGIQSECVVMAPGSSWSEESGFNVIPFDYSSREAHIQSLLERHSAELAAQYEKEAAAIADFTAFRAYFEGLIRSIPWLVRRWLGARVVFRTTDPNGEHNWLVDLASADVEEIGASTGHPVIETPPLVLNDCAKIHMFSAWTPSKRLRIHLSSRDQLRPVMIFLVVLDLYELGILPLRKNLSFRAVTVRLRRWREFVEMGRMFLKHVVLRQPIDIARLYSSSAI